MKESFCEILLDYYPGVLEVDDLFSTYIANCVFNSFLSYTDIMFNMVTIHAIRKTSSLPKTLKTLLLSLAVSDVGVGLVNQPFYTSILIKWIQQSNSGCNTYKVFPHYYIFIFLGFVLGCCSCKCGQVLSYSSSSQISGTCDSQASCFCGDLNMGDKCISSFFNICSFALYLFTYYGNSGCSRCHSYNYSLHQDLFSPKKTQESDSDPASTTSGTS